MSDQPQSTFSLYLMLCIQCPVVGFRPTSRWDRGHLARVEGVPSSTPTKPVADIENAA